MSERQIRCAIYTRKSSEEGLDQTFNSIHAQREACEAYILSQRHEGWVALPRLYDDGGFSGGTLKRPAVQQLLADIKAGNVDLVVVYKIDRLTRSLADFAKLVEVFDANKASFVSVTQHFNTTTSMGRLTLNVLLSFAQFEREVTGERIRDKIAASKKKGMWMGGVVPLGYDAVDRHLVVNPEEAKVVRSIFELYLETGNVRTVVNRLAAGGVLSKKWTTSSGRVMGGLRFGPGAIYKLLKSRLYLGEVPHKDSWYPGEHEALMDVELFDRVQGALALQLDRRRKGVHAKEPSLLAGLVIDKDLNRLIPSHALKKGKRYRYYVSRPAKDAAPASDAWISKTSVPAHDLENLVIKAISEWLSNPARLVNDLKLGQREADERKNLIQRAETYAERLRQGSMKEQRALLLPILSRVSVQTEVVKIAMRPKGTLRALGIGQVFDEKEDALAEDAPTLSVAARLRRYGMEMRLVVNEEWATVEEPEPDAHLVLALARAHTWWERLTSGRAKSIAEIAETERVSAGYVAKLLRGALLAPDILEIALERTVPGLTLKTLVEPHSSEWKTQMTTYLDMKA